MLNIIIKNFSFFHKVCESEFTDIKIINKLIKEINHKGDIPLYFLGILYEMITDNPNYYWDRAVAQETHSNLKKYCESDEELFGKTFSECQEFMFYGIDNYHSIIKTYHELNEIVYNEELKTRIYRNQVYSRLCEECLMNFYRFFRGIITCFSEKDYSTQDTLGQLIPALQKNGFIKASEIDTNLRNSINHGNVFVSGNDVTYRFKVGNQFQSEQTTVWQYDRKIGKTLDIAGGILVGIVRFLSEFSHVLLEQLNILDNENIIFEWMKLFYRTSSTKLEHLSKSVDGSQLNVNLSTNLEDKDHVIFMVTEVIRGLYLFIPSYDRYLVVYNHERGSGGFLRLTSQQLEDLDQVENATLIQRALDSKEIYVTDIYNYDVNDRVYSLYRFPIIKGKDWFMQEIKDTSIIDHKRIKGELIIERKVSKKKTLSIINNAINQLKTLWTPRNPKEDVPWGETEADIVLLQVYYKSTTRDSFNLFTKNKYFVCLAHYYATSESPRLKDGGVFDWLWAEYKKEKYKKIEIAWNPISLRKM